MPSTLALAVSSACLASAHLYSDPRDHDAIERCRAHLLSAIGELERLTIQAAGHRVDIRYLSPCPPGYDTVLGYLAKRDPETLGMLEQDPSATADDGVWCRARCITLGLAFTTVEACPWLRLQHGVRKVHAYPVQVLHEWHQATDGPGIPALTATDVG